MHDAFGIVLWVVVIGGVIAALVTFALSRDTYDQIGRGGLFEEEPGRARGGGGGGATSGPERDAEIRQMLEARNARRVRRGEEPVDIEAELAALTRPAIDAGLLAEIRDLVEARNARRIRQGREPLDVEAEIARQIEALE